MNVTVSVGKGLRKGRMAGESGPEFKAASGAIGVVKSVLGRGPVRSLLERISKYRSHYLDRQLKFVEARDKIWEIRHDLRIIAKATGDEETQAMVEDLDTFLSKLSSTWKAGATFEEGQAAGTPEPEDG